MNSKLPEMNWKPLSAEYAEEIERRDQVELPEIQIEVLIRDDETIYRAHIKLPGESHHGEGSNPSEALLLAAARWHAYKDVKG